MSHPNTSYEPRHALLSSLQPDSPRERRPWAASRDEHTEIVEGTPVIDQPRTRHHFWAFAAAFALLRNTAMQTQSKLPDVARGVVHTAELAEALERAGAQRMLSQRMVKLQVLRQWPRPAADVHKHYGYAFQWFGLCALIAILYVWFQFIQPRRRAA